MIRIRFASAALAAALSIAPAAAAPEGDAQGDRMVAAFQSWAQKWGVANASFAVLRDAAVVGETKVGAGDPRAARPVASLSKAVTGVCVAKLVEARKLKYSSRLGALLKSFFRKNPPADPAARDITVGQLLTHASGIAYDPTQGTAELSALDFSKTNLLPVTAMALGRTLGAKAYVYNNANYAALGLVIEAVTGKSYQSACAEAVLAPAKVKTASFDPDWRIMSAWGGWRMSAVDYARFLDHFRPASGLMTSRPTAWPKSDLGGGAFYALGTYLRSTDVSYNFWHAGAWRWFDAAVPARNENYGAYFVVMRQNLRYVANYMPQPPSGALNDLDVAMWAAAYPASGRGPRVDPATAAPAPAENGSDRGLEDIHRGQAR